MGREPDEVALHHAGPDGLESCSRRDDTYRRRSGGAYRARQSTPGLDPGDSDRPGRNGPGRAASRLRVGPREAPPAMGQGLSYPTRCRTPKLDHSFESYRVRIDIRENDLRLTRQQRHPYALGPITAKTGRAADPAARLAARPGA